MRTGKINVALITYCVDKLSTYTVLQHTFGNKANPTGTGTAAT
jgi:hypothetical protein